MNQPLGRLAGNGLEIDESVECLQGGGPADLREITIALGAEGLRLAGVVSSDEEGRKKITSTLDDGAAYEKLAQMVRVQEGDLEAPRPRAAESVIEADRAGYIAQIDTEAIGWAVIELGGGRKTKEDQIDPTVGVETLVRLGEYVEADRPLFRVFGPTDRIEKAMPFFQKAITLADGPSEAPCLIAERID